MKGRTSAFSPSFIAEHQAGLVTRKGPGLPYHPPIPPPTAPPTTTTHAGPSSGLDTCEKLFP